MTANVRGILLAKSSGAGSVCGALYVDLFVAGGGGGGERRAHSKLVGRSCEQGHQSLFNSIVLTDLKAGESYVLRGRLECAYANIPQTSTGAGAGSFLCSTSGTEVTLVWPFGVKTR